MCSLPGTSLTLDYNFVNCVNQKCVCRTDQGFTGDATSDSPCFCDASLNRTILWGPNGTAYCDDPISRAPIEESQDPEFTQSCKFHYECSEATTMWGAVDCIADLCTCRNDLGFSGSGNETDPCVCADGKMVFWLENNPYCVVFPPPAPIQEYPTLAEIHDALLAELETQGAALVLKINAVFIITIKGDAGDTTWCIDLRTGSGSITETPTAEQMAAALTITMSEMDFLLMAVEKATAQDLYLAGKILVGGNMDVVMKLPNLHITVDGKFNIHFDITINLKASK